jgi:aminoglycoside N3'-acetyltransferase
MKYRRIKYRLNKFRRIQRSFTKGRKHKESRSGKHKCRIIQIGRNLIKERLFTLFNNK